MQCTEHRGRVLEVLDGGSGPGPGAAYTPFEDAGWVSPPLADGGCPPGESHYDVDHEDLCVRASGDQRVVWSFAPERSHLVVASVGLAYVPSIRRAGAVVDLEPVMRRPFDGGFAYGLGLSFIDAGPDFRRATLALALEYDVSSLWRESVDGIDRALQLVLGVESGLSLRAQDTEFGQVLALGVALDPFVEARIRLDPHLGVIGRGSVLLALDRLVTAAVVLHTGLVIEW